MSEELAFEGLKVLDMSQGVAAPYCGMLLAQNGADVIKVEPPVPGDWSRAMGKPYDDQSAASVILNRGKRSIAHEFQEARRGRDHEAACPQGRCGAAELPARA